VLSVNGFMVLVICVYAPINGLEGIRAGGHKVDPKGVIWFSFVSGAVCLVVWVYERRSLELPLEDVWLSICLTGDSRWV
jgi:predicted Co/Zn/Cd cation transporter (cation efflux family)